MGRFILPRSLIFASPSAACFFFLSSLSRRASRSSCRRCLVVRLVRLVVSVSFLRLVLVLPGVSFVVSFACLSSYGARVFSFRRSPRCPPVVLVVSVFRLVRPSSFVVFLRLVPASRCLLVGGGAIDAMWHGMGRPWLRVMMGMGARPSVVLVLLACSRLPMPAGIRSSRPPRLRLLACRG